MINAIINAASYTKKELTFNIFQWIGLIQRVYKFMAKPWKKYCSTYLRSLFEVSSDF